MGATLNFDARSVPPAEAFEPIPAGWYNVKIVESEMKPTANGQGSYLALTLQVIDGQYANRKLFDRLNLDNQNPTAKEIAWRTLSAICYATGVLQVQTTDQLHGLPMQCRVTIRPPQTGQDGRQYDAQNEVKGYRKVESVQPSMPAPGAFGAFQGPSAPSFTPPVAPPQAPTAMPPSFAPPVVPQAPAHTTTAPPAPTPPSFAGGNAQSSGPVPPWAQPKQ